MVGNLNEEFARWELARALKEIEALKAERDGLRDELARRTAQADSLLQTISRRRVRR